MKDTLYFPAVVMGFSSDAALAREMQPFLSSQSGAEGCDLADELAGMRQRGQMFMHLQCPTFMPLQELGRPGQVFRLLLVARAEGRAGIGLVIVDKDGASLEDVERKCLARNEALPPGITAVPVPAFLVREALQ